MTSAPCARSSAIKTTSAAAGMLRSSEMISRSRRASHFAMASSESFPVSNTKWGCKPERLQPLRKSATLRFVTSNSGHGAKVRQYCGSRTGVKKSRKLSASTTTCADAGRCTARRCGNLASCPPSCTRRPNVEQILCIVKSDFQQLLRGVAESRTAMMKARLQGCGAPAPDD
eukprot:1065849-Rhodomonas_salina.1